MQHYVVRSKVDKSSGKAKKRYYGIPVIAGQITEEEMAEEISERCSLSPTDVIAVIDALNTSMKMHLEDGRSVRLKGIGIFYVSGSSDGVDTPEECTPSKVRAQRICFRADRSLRSVLGKIVYKLRKPSKKAAQQ